MTNRPILNAIEKAVANRLLKDDVPVNDNKVSEVAVKAAAAAEPIVTNAMNAEQPWQSRVIVGSSIAGLAAIKALLDMWQSGQFDVNTGSTAIATILGIAFALYGRLRSGLRPMFTKKG